MHRTCCDVTPHPLELLIPSSPSALDNGENLNTDELVWTCDVWYGVHVTIT